MGLTILLVDDDQILTEKTKNSLNWDSLGIGMVFTANNIHEARQHTKQQRQTKLSVQEPT